MPTQAKPRSAAAKGSYYKSRTKAFLERNGWQVAFLERMLPIFRPPINGVPQRQIFKKVDQFGADLLAVNADTVAFVQVKLQSGRLDVAAAVRKFREFTFPPTARRLIYVWQSGAREPMVIDAETYQIGERRVAQRETLF